MYYSVGVYSVLMTMNLCVCVFISPCMGGPVGSVCVVSLWPLYPFTPSVSFCLMMILVYLFWPMTEASWYCGWWSLIINQTWLSSPGITSCFTWSKMCWHLTVKSPHLVILLTSVITFRLAAPTFLQHWWITISLTCTFCTVPVNKQSPKRLN